MGRPLTTADGGGTDPMDPSHPFPSLGDNSKVAPQKVLVRLSSQQLENVPFYCVPNELSPITYSYSRGADPGINYLRINPCLRLCFRRNPGKDTVIC